MFVGKNLNRCNLSVPAGYGGPTGGFCCHLPVRHAGFRLHHSCSSSHPGFPAEVCAGAPSPRHQRTTFTHLRKYRSLSFPLIWSLTSTKKVLNSCFIFQTLEIIFKQITSSNMCDVVIALVIMLVVFVVKELNDRFKSKLPVPIPIEVIMVSCIVQH